MIFLADAASDLAAGVFLYILPGWALLELLGKEAKLGWQEKAGLAAGLSLSLYPLLFLYFHLLGVTPGKLLAWGPGCLSLLALLWRRGRAVSWRRRARADLHSVVFVVLVILLLLVRLDNIRSMSAPAWGDSVHHTMIVQLIVEQGGLFSSWAPYAPMTTFTYHFGFHSAAAVWAWVMGVPTPQAVLVAGQILNVLAVLALYPLAVRLTGQKWAGIAAMMTAGFFSEMPGFYTNWGRYTQLAGQVILPAGIWLIDLIWKKDHRLRSRELLLLAFLIAGLILTHNRVALMLAAAALGWAILSLASMRAELGEWTRRFGQFAVSGVAALIVVSPWIYSVMMGTVGAAWRSTFPSSEVSPVVETLRLWRSSSLYISGYFLLAGAAGLSLAFWKKRRLAGQVSLWIVLCLVFSNPFIVGLGVTGRELNFVVMIGLYIPIALVLGWLFGELAGAMDKSVGTVILLASSLLVLSVVGAVRQSRIIDPFFQMVTPNDLAAFRWIRGHVPKSAKFLVNGLVAAGDFGAVGSDAGWWLPFYTKRQSVIPPTLYRMEQVSPPFDHADPPRVVLEVGKTLGDLERLADICRREGITHVYLGEKRGSVSYEPGELVPETWLRSGKAFARIHSQGMAQVWELVESPERGALPLALGPTLRDRARRAKGNSHQSLALIIHKSSSTISPWREAI